jgi:cytochrome c oxidase subunit IV
MSETVTETQAAEAEDHSHDHPSDWAYIKIALLLGAITGVEVFTYFRSVLDWGDFLIPALLFMMVIKFWLVATWFMHLKFDNSIFSRMFVGGLVLAVGVYVIALATFEFWER